MKFYNREQELNILRRAKELSASSSRMTVVVGRRRVGKTKLIIKSSEDDIMLYFFIARKNEKLLCAELSEQIQDKLEVKLFGSIERFSDLFEFLMQQAKTKQFTLIIDEFQELNRVNPSIFSDLQKIWDINKEATKMNLIISGSIYSMMTKIFEQSKEPLFGRADEKIHLKPFNVNALKHLFYKENTKGTYQDLLAFYCITGGVAKYVEYFVDRSAYSLNEMLDLILQENSIFIDEGMNVLIEEFGKDYAVYFSILTLIASSKTGRNEIESILERNVGGYLDRLEKDYTIVQKMKPIFSKPESRKQKYAITDNFLNFWFRFIYKYRSAIEIGNYQYIKDIVKRDFESFSGRFLEKYFLEKIALTGNYNDVGTYWGKKNQDEIDIIAVNDAKKEIHFGEVKRNKNKASKNGLIQKSATLQQIKGKHYKTSYKIYSLEDM